VGVDGTGSGRDAVALGALLARPTAAELMLIAVRREPLLAVALSGDVSWAASEKQARTMLDETRNSMAPDARVMFESDTLIWRALRRVARREHRDLIVVGSAHDAPEGQVRLGKTAGDLHAHLECPLAVAPSGMADRGQLSLERIGVGFDGRPESRAALGLAASIALAAAAELQVRGAVDDGVAGGLTVEQIALEGDAIITRQLASAFERDVEAAQGTGVPTRVEVEVAMAPDLLSELADQVDLLVIGSGHTGPAGRLEFGPTGRALLNLASCPVLVVPRPRD
jgi:nucleotide-binding universal stress UspA family protein